MQYHDTHERLHPKYRKSLHDKGCHDIFMLDLDGNLVYSVYKELAYATNFAASGAGQWKESGLGRAVCGSLVTPDVTVIDGWALYGPSNGALASFLWMGRHGQWCSSFR